MPNLSALLIGLLFFIATGQSKVNAQAVYAGDQVIEKVTLPGFFLTIAADSKLSLIRI